MKNEIAQDIEMLIQHTTKTASTHDEVYRAALRVEVFLATYEPEDKSI